MPHEWDQEQQRYIQIHSILQMVELSGKNIQ